MLFDTNKNKGRTGLAVAIAYYATHGYNVCIPLNDTQDYDLVVDKDGVLLRVQVKATAQRTKRGYTTFNAFSSGGTNGGKYQYLKDTSCDIVFVLTELGEMYEIPLSDISVVSSFGLGPSRQHYRVDDLDTKYISKQPVAEVKYCNVCGKLLSQKNKTGLCKECFSDKRFNHKRPSRDVFKNDIRTCYFKDVCEKYHLSLDGLRSWCRYFNLPTSKHAIDKYTDEEWAKM